jgi:hypothetical protein
MLLVLGAGAIWPILLGRMHPSWVSELVATIGLVVPVAAMTAIVIRRPMPYPPRSSEPGLRAETEAG